MLTVKAVRIFAPTLRRQECHFFSCKNLSRNFFSTSDPVEVENFSTLNLDWWDENGPLKALHSMNRVRVPWVRDTLTSHRATHTLNDREPLLAKPLRNCKILDVGCGGGILSEPLARLGAKVLGLDTGQGGLDVAMERLENFRVSRETLDLHYLNCPIENLALHADYKNSKFDAIVASEVIEHVSNREVFVQNCSKLLDVGGLLFLTTLSRTFLSKFFAIFLAENVLNILPKGIHDWEKFVHPDDLELTLERHNFHVKLVHGLCYNPLTNCWSWIDNKNINYAICAVKI